MVVKEGKIFIPKFKDGIKVKLDKREIKGKIGKMNITKTPTGKYYVSIFTEQTIEQLPKTNKKVGIDLGLTGTPESYIIDKNGVIRFHYIGAIDADISREYLGHQYVLGLIPLTSLYLQHSPDNLLIEIGNNLTLLAGSVTTKSS